MAQTNKAADQAAHGEQDIAAAQRRLMRQPKQQGVHPLSFEEMLGDNAYADAEKEDVDQFLAMLREWRSEPYQSKID